MTASSVETDLTKNPLIEVGIVYTVGAFLEQLLVLELRGTLDDQTNTGNFVLANGAWAESLPPNMGIKWVRKNGQTVPMAVPIG